MNDPLDPRSYITPHLLGAFALIAVFFQGLRLWRPSALRVETPRRRSMRTVSAIVFIGLMGMSLLNLGSLVDVTSAAAAGPTVTLTKDTTARFTAAGSLSSDVAIRFTASVAVGAGVTVTVADTTGLTVGMRLRVEDGANDEWIVLTAVTATSITADFALAHTAPFVAGTGAAVVKIAGAITANAVSQTVTVNNTANVVVNTVLQVDNGASAEYVTVTAFTATSFTAIFAKSHLADTPATRARMSFDTNSVALRADATNTTGESTLVRATFAAPVPVAGKGSHAIEGPNGLYLVPHGFNNVGTSTCKATWSLFDSRTNVYTAGSPNLTSAICSGSFSIKTAADTFLLMAGGRLTATTIDASATPLNTVRIRTASLVLTAAVAATGAQTVTVDNTNNIAVGTQLRIDSGAQAETVTVTAFSAGVSITATFAKTHLANAPAAGFTIAAGPSLTGTTGAGVGAHAIKRTDGSFLIVHGGLTAGTSLVTGAATPAVSAGPAGTTSCTSTSTSTCSLATVLGTSVVGDGALSIQRPDGLSFGLVGGGASTSALKTFVYNQASSPGGFTLGTAVPSNTYRPGAGAHAIQFNDASVANALRYRVIIGNASTAVASYDPAGAATTTTLVAVTAAGQVPTAVVGAGAFSLRRADGSYLTFLGNASTVTNVFSAKANPATFVVGPASPAAIGAGAHAVQQADGDYLVRVGGALGSAVSAFYDGGYRLSGEYTTEPLNPGNVDQWKTLRWTKNADVTLALRVRSATTSAGLATATYTDYATSTSLTGTQTLSVAVPTKWVQVQAVFSRPIPVSGGAQAGVWLGSDSIAFDRAQTTQSPTLTKLELDYSTGEFVITGGATQSAGVSFTPTVVLADSLAAAIVDYTGSHTLTLSGLIGATPAPIAAPDGTVPTVNGTAFSGGSATTAVTFASGSATPAMILYKAQGPILTSASELTGTGSATTYGLTSVTIPTRLSPEGRYSVTVDAGAAVAANSTLTRSPASRLADNLETFLLTMTLKDAYQNIVVGRIPTVTSLLPATFSTPAPTDAAGVTTATVRSGRAAVHTITADGALGPTTTVDFRPTIISVDPGVASPTAGQTFTLKLTASGDDLTAAKNYAGTRTIGFSSTATRRTAPVNRMGPTIPATLSVTFAANGTGTTSSSFILTNAVELPTITAFATAEYRTLTITPAVTASLSAQTVTVSNTTYVVPGTRLLVDTGVNAEVVQVLAVPSATQIQAVFLKAHSAGVSATGGAQGTSAPITVQEGADDSLVVFTRYVDFTLTNAVTGSPTPQTVAVSNTTNVLIGLTIVLVVEDLSALESTTVSAVPSPTSITAVFAQSHAAGTRVRKGDIYTDTLQTITKSPSPQTVLLRDTVNIVVGSRIFIDSGAAAEQVQVTAVNLGVSVTGIFVKDHPLNTRVVQGEIQTANVPFTAHLVLIDIAGNPVTGLSGNKVVTFTSTATQRPQKTLLPSITGHPTNVQTIAVNNTTGISTVPGISTELNVDTGANGELVSVTPLAAGAGACLGPNPCVVGVFKKNHVAGTLTIQGLAPVMTASQNMTFNSGEVDAPSTFTFMNRSETPTLSATLSYGTTTYTGSSTAQTVQVNVIDAATSELTVIPTPPLVNALDCLFDACVNADGVETATWTVRVYDIAKNPLETRTVNLTSDRGVIDTITQPGIGTDPAGIASGTIRSTAPGNATIQARAEPRNPSSNFLLPLDTSEQLITMTRIVRFGGLRFVLTVIGPSGGVPDVPAVPAIGDAPSVNLTIDTAVTVTGAQTVKVSNTTNVVVGRGLNVDTLANAEVVVVQQILADNVGTCPASVPSPKPCIRAVFAKTHAAGVAGKVYGSVNAGTAFSLHIIHVNGSDTPVTTYTGNKTITLGTSATARLLPDLGPAAGIPSPQVVTFTAGQASLPSQFTLFNSAETPVVTATEGGAFLGLTPPLTVVPQVVALGAALTITPAITTSGLAQTVAVTLSPPNLFPGNVVLGTRLVIESGTLNNELVTVTEVVTTATGPCPSASCIKAIFTKSHAAGVKARFGSLLSALPTSASADGVATSTITATITDQFHNPRSGFSVTINTDGQLGTCGTCETLSPSSGATQPAIGVSDPAGVFVATATSKAVRTATYNVTISGTGGANGTCAALTTVIWTIAQNSTDHFSITYQGQVTDFIITPAITASGTEQTVTVSNTANFIGPVSFTITPGITASGSPQTVTVSNTNGFAPGDRLVIDTGAAAETITVTATTPTSLTAVFARNHAAGLVVQMGADQLVIDSAGNQETIAITGKTATSISAVFTKSHVAGLRVVNTQAGATFGFIVTARKPNEDPDTNYCTTACTVRFTHTGTTLGAFIPEPVSPTNLVVTFVNGVYSTTATFAKLYKIEESVTFNVLDVNDANGANGTTVPIRVRPAPADPLASYVFAFRRTAPADGTTEVKLWARATDPFGNAVSQIFAFSALRDGTAAGLTIDGSPCPCTVNRGTDSVPATGTATSPIVLKSTEPGKVVVTGTMSGVGIRSTEIYFTTPGVLNLVGTYWGEVNDGTVVKYPLELTPYADCKFRACELDYPNFKQGQPLPFSASTITVWRVFTKDGVGAPGSGDFDNPSGVPFGPTMNTSKNYCGTAGCESLSNATDHKTALLVLKAGHLCVTAEWQNPDATLTIVDVVGTTTKDVNGAPTACIQTPANIVGAGVYEVTSTVDATTTRARVIWDGSPNDNQGLMRVLSWWTIP